MTQRMGTTLAVVLGLSGCALFDRPAPSSVAGTVQEYPEGTPLSGALVRITGTDKVVRVDEQGKFLLQDVGASASLQFYAPGHPISTRTFHLLPGETRTVDVPLAREGQTVPSRTVLFERSGRIWSVDGLGSDERCLTADVAGTQAAPTWLAGRSQFAFIQRMPGRTQVWTRYPDGRPARFVSEVPDSADELRWHPLGDLLAFTASRFSASRGMVTSIRSLDFNTGTQTEIVSGALEQDPAWSQDGRQLAWARRGAPKPWQIWVAGSHGERPRALLSRGNCVEPTWSPSGEQLAYASNATGTWEIYLAGVSTGLSEQLTHTPEGGWCRHPVWSPEGDEILFESNDYPGMGQLQTEPGLYAWRLSNGTVRAIAPEAHGGTW